jgi:hypothetical protein
MIIHNETIAVILDEIPVSLAMFRGVYVVSWFIEQCFYSFIGYMVFKKLCQDEMSTELGRMWKEEFWPSLDHSPLLT